MLLVLSIPPNADFTLQKLGHLLRPIVGYRTAEEVREELGCYVCLHPGNSLICTWLFKNRQEAAEAEANRIDYTKEPVHSLVIGKLA